MKFAKFLALAAICVGLLGAASARADGHGGWGGGWHGHGDWHGHGGDDWRFHRGYGYGYGYGGYGYRSWPHSYAFDVAPYAVPAVPYGYVPYAYAPYRVVPAPGGCILTIGGYVCY